MGLLDLFKSAPSQDKIIADYRDKLLLLYGKRQATDSDRFKCTIALTIAAIGVINEVSAGAQKKLIDEISESSYRLCHSLRFTLAEISEDTEFINEVLSQIPGGGSPNTTVNGGVMFPSFFNYYGPQFVQEICNKKEGPMGSIGTATIIVGKVAVGDSRKSFLEVSFLVAEFIRAIIK